MTSAIGIFRQPRAIPKGFTLSTTIAPEPTYRWEKTRPSHDRFNRLKKDRLWRSVRFGGLHHRYERAA